MQHFTRAISQLAEGQSITVGSGDAADVLLTGDEVAPLHARVTRWRGELKVRDLDSDAGTFVNGIEVRGLMPICAGDTLRLGRLELRIGGAVPSETPSAHVPVVMPRVAEGMSITLERATVSVTAGGLLNRPERDILKEASIHIAPGQFVGILGASGSGKSTLIKTIAGLVSISAGRILLDGQPVSAHELQKDRRIAYLPQDVVIHEQITVRRALGYIAELKGAGSSARALAQIVAGVAEHTGLTDRLDVPIRRLSGGQRKRAALAAELIGDPQLILLDEATSGLDPATEGEMMRLFRSLADEGRTVVCITHFPDRLALCDRLIYLMDGQVAFVGPPAELQHLFGTPSIEEVYLAQASRSVGEWRREYEASPAGQAAVHELGAAVAAAAAPDGAASASRASTPAHDSRAGGAAQLFTLLRRYFALQRADWPNLLLLFLQAPAIAFMIALSYGSIRADFFELQAADTKEVIF
ncbi:MAG: ATP-binding cassette domain-containing protein, partial [Chromatiaceae bacterium]|nr:ATP-binding cassette domain-containing protein [Chromatiaceae bacterium]